MSMDISLGNIPNYVTYLRQSKLRFPKAEATTSDTKPATECLTAQNRQVLGPPDVGGLQC